MLPEGWKQSRLSSCGVSVIDGDRGKSYPNGDDFSDQGYCLFLSAKNITKSGFSFEECQFISESKHRALRKGAVVKGDMVLTTRGTVGNIGYFVNDTNFGAIRINSGMVVLRNGNPQLDSDFLYLVMRSPLIEKQVEQMNFGSAQPQLTVQIINNFVLPVPSLPEQQKIAEILFTWDRAIAVQERLITNARAQKKALMQTLLTAKKRLPGFTEKWSSNRLDEIAIVSMGSSPPSTAYNDSGLGLPLIQGNADISKRLAAPRFFTSEITQICKAGDIIFSVRAPVGEIATATDEACLGRGVAGIRPRVESDQTYLYYVLIHAEDRWGMLSQGSTFQAISGDALKGFEFSAPPTHEERKAIGELIQNADALENNLIEQRNRYLQEKSALMQQLLTGKRRVKIEETVK